MKDYLICRSYVIINCEFDKLILIRKHKLICYLPVLDAPIKDWENQTKDLYLEFNEEDEIKLNCSMDGYPKPNYFWSRNE